MSRWPRIRPRVSQFGSEFNTRVADVEAATSGNPVNNKPRHPVDFAFGGRHVDGDVRVFWTYNVKEGFLADPTDGPWSSGAPAGDVHDPPTVPKYSWKHPMTGWKRVAGTEGTTDLQLAQGWGGKTHHGHNLFWGGGMYGGYFNGIEAYIPRGIDWLSRHDGAGNSTEPGYPEIGVGYSEPGYYSYAWSDYYTPTGTTNYAPVMRVWLTFRNENNRSNQCPVYSGDELGPKIYTASTGNLTNYVVPGPFPNAPYGSLMVRINAAYWNTSKRHVPETISGGVPPTGLGHDSWYVAQPDTPGLHRFISVWPNVGSYTANGSNPNNPIAITEGALVSVDIKYIGEEGTPLSAFGRFYNSSDSFGGWDPSSAISPGGKDHTHTWDLVTDAHGYTLSNPDWVTHTSFLIKGGQQYSANHQFMGQFMGGPTTVTMP